MKKKIFIAILLFGVLVIVCFIPVKEKSIVTIEAPVIAISQQINNAANWKKWNNSLKKDLLLDSSKYTVTNDYSLHTFSIATPQQSFMVKSPTGNRFEITNKRNGRKFHYDVLLATDKKSNSTNLVIEEKLSLFASIFSLNKNEKPDTNIFNYLKKFMETDSLYYGFPIEIRKVVDSNVVVLNRHIIAEEKFVVPSDMLKELKAYTTANELTITEPLMLQYSNLPPDSLNVLTMLSVNKPMGKKSNIRFMKMPVNGRMLVGYFKGKFKDRIQLQIAMQQYILDKNIYSIVGSYEKYVNNNLPENEDSIVEIEMYFPIL